MTETFHTSRCAKCGAVTAAPHAYDIRCSIGPHDWRTLVEQRPSSPMPGAASPFTRIERLLASWEEAPRAIDVDRLITDVRDAIDKTKRRAADSSGETRSDAEKALSDLVDLVEMDEEASQVGSPLWLAVTTAKEILARRSSRFTVSKCPACFADKPCPSQVCEHPDRALPFTRDPQVKP